MKSNQYIITTSTLGVIFLFSSIAKAVDVKSFALLISYFNIARNPTLVTAAAIFIIIAEFGIGMAIILSWRLRLLLLKTSLAMLVFFTGVVIYGWVFKELEDCGCFGSFIKISPLVSIFKNLIMIGMNVFAIAGLTQNQNAPPSDFNVIPLSKPFRTAFAAVCPLLLIGSLAWSFRGTTPAKPSAETTVQSVPAAAGRPFAQFKVPAAGNESYDLGQESYLVAFLSDSCSHCQETVGKLNSSLKELPQLPIIGLILGEEDTLRQFRQQFKPQFPTAIVKPLTFFEFIGDAPPRFHLITNGKLIKYWDEDLPKTDDLKALLPDKLKASAANSPDRPAPLQIANWVKGDPTTLDAGSGKRVSDRVLGHLVPTVPRQYPSF